MKLINNFLKAPNYLVGACIVRAIGSNTDLINRIRANTATLPDITKELQQFQSKTTTDQYRAQWFPLYARMNYLRGQLDAFGTDNSAPAQGARRQLAFEILNLEQRINHIWAQADWHRQTGQPYQHADDVLPVDPVQLAKFINNKRRQLQKLRKKPPTENTAAQIAQLEQLLAKL